MTNCLHNHSRWGEGDQTGAAGHLLDQKTTLSALGKIQSGEINQKIFHWSDKGQISWYEFAKEISLLGKELGILEEKVEILKINASDFKADAIRPSYSVLDCSSTENSLKIKQKNWDIELKKVMNELKHGKFKN